MTYNETWFPDSLDSYSFIDLGTNVLSNIDIDAYDNLVNKQTYLSSGNMELVIFEIAR